MLRASSSLNEKLCHLHKTMNALYIDASLEIIILKLSKRQPATLAAGARSGTVEDGELPTVTLCNGLM